MSDKLLFLLFKRVEFQLSEFPHAHGILDCLYGFGMGCEHIAGDIAGRNLSLDFRKFGLT